MNGKKSKIEFECSDILRDAFDEASKKQFGITNARSLALREQMRKYCEMHGTLPQSP